MNEKAPEVAERSSKRKYLRMGRSSEKVARRPGSEMMWTSGGGCRTCNHKGSNPGTVAAALGPTMARSGEGRTAGVRRACTRKEMCRLPAGVQAHRVPGRVLAGPKTPFDQQVAHVAYDSTLSSTPVCDSTLSRKIFVGVMRMDVSSIQAPLRMRVATESGEDSTLSIHRSQSACGGQKPRRRSAAREGSHSRNDGNPLVDGPLTVRRMQRVVGTC